MRKKNSIKSLNIAKKNLKKEIAFSEEQVARVLKKTEVFNLPFIDSLIKLIKSTLIK